VATLGLRVDESSPWVDARLSDGSLCRPNFLAPHFCRAKAPPPQPSHASFPSSTISPLSAARALWSADLVTLFRRSAGPPPSFALRWAADSQQRTHLSTGEAPMRWIRDPYRRPWWSRKRWDRERWLNVLFFAIVAAGVAVLLVFLKSPQLAVRTFVGNSGIGWWDRVPVMPDGAMPESPEESAGPSDLVAAVTRWLQSDALEQAFTALYAPVIGTKPTTGAGNEGSEPPPATDPQPTPPVPLPTTTAIPPAPAPTATDSPEPPASETSSPSPSDSPSESPSPSDSPTESPSPSDSPSESPSPSDSPTQSPPPSGSPTRSPHPSGSPSP
jgi:hypothetical protein